MKKRILLLVSILVVLLLNPLTSIPFTNTASLSWAATAEPDWDSLDKVTLTMVDWDNIVFTEDIPRNPENEKKYNFKASYAIETVLGFYWNDPAVVEIVSINGFPLKNSRFKAWSGKIDPKLKGLAAQKNPDRIRQVEESNKRRDNMELIDISIVTLRVNNQLLKPDVAPYIEQGRVMIPFRPLYEALGGQVNYDFSNQQRVWMRIDQGNSDYTELTMTVGSKIARKVVHSSGTDIVTEVEMDVCPQIVGNRTFIPARYAAELLNLSIGWNNDIREAYISGTLPTKSTPSN